MPSGNITLCTRSDYQHTVIQRLELGIDDGNDVKVVTGEEHVLVTIHYGLNVLETISYPNAEECPDGNYSLEDFLKELELD